MSKSKKLRSLARHLFYGFVACASLIWISLVVWGVFSAFQSGEKEVADDLDDYARQVLAVVKEFSDTPQRVSKVIEEVEKIEKEDEGLAFENEFRIQIWLNDEPVRHIDGFINDEPKTAGFSEIKVADVPYWSAVAIDPETSAIVRISAKKVGVATISTRQSIFLFLPLAISLPILFVPAWIMSRSGLKPLNEVVSQLRDRAESGQLDPLSDTKYRELNPVVQTTNLLMNRLDQQLRREREFVTNVAHELKTPMAVLQCNAGILENTEDSGRKENALRDLKAGIQRSNHLIQQLLRMARMEQQHSSQIKLHNLDLAEFVRERVAHAETLAANKNVRLICNTPASIVHSVDADAFAAVVDNLLDNAIKYSKPGGSIQIKLGVDDSQEKLKLYIHDDGPGMESSKIAQAFERFQRFDLNNAEGAGLGLAIVTQACKRLGAKVSLRNSTMQLGLIVEFELPLVPASLEA